MPSENFLVSYSICKNCNKDLNKAGNSFCRECKPKLESSRTLNKKLSKVFINKFESKSSSHNKSLAKKSNNLEPGFRCIRFRLKKELTLPTYKKSPEWFVTLFWDQFTNFDSFSSFIVTSGQIGTSYFTLNSFEIQKKPIFQQFIRSKIDEVPVVLPPMQIMLPVPHSRPIYLLTQEYYWDKLLESYFNHLHPIIPLFSIHSFNPRTASKYLLSALCFGGFLFMHYRPTEIMDYFSERAKDNIKELARVVSFKNLQAMTLYSFIFILIGEFTLSRACQAHTIRMSYSLGIHLNLKKLPPIQQYDRLKIFSTICTLHIGLSGASHLALNYITEIGESNNEITKPEYQIPNHNCSFYFDTEDENIEYGICADTFTRFHDDVSISHWKLSQCSDRCIEDEFEKGLIEINQRYLDCLENFNVLLREFPHLKTKILSQKYQLELMYRELNLEKYRILKNRLKKLKSHQIYNMYDECCILLDSVIDSQDYIQLSHIFPYSAGINFISLYNMSNSSLRILILDKLADLMNFLSNRYCDDKLAYLAIKNEYEAILKL